MNTIKAMILELMFGRVCLRQIKSSLTTIFCLNPLVMLALFASLLIGLSNQAFAATPVSLSCSATQAGAAVINEVQTQNSFIEIYFLKTADLANWSLWISGSGPSPVQINLGSGICRANGTATLDNASTGQANVTTWPTGTFIVCDTSVTIPSQGEILLVDKKSALAAGDTTVIDSLNYGNPPQNEWSVAAACATTYDAHSASNKDIARLPDGSGTLIDNGNASTKGGSNTGAPLINHYEVNVPSSNVACLASTVTAKACADSSSPCTNIVTTFNGTATLSASAGTIGTTSLNFAGGAASTTLSYPTATNGGTSTLTLSAESVVASNARTCCIGSTCSTSNTCTATFNTAGFIFASTATGPSTTLLNQTAGTASGTYYLRAVQTNTSTGACISALSGAQLVNMAYQCNNPTTCSNSNLMSINGGAATTIQRNDNTAVSSYTPVNMNFDGNGSAPFSYTFNDVGMVTLYAQKAASGILLTTLTGNSNAFVVKPAGFVLTAIKCTTANAANCGAGALAMPTPGDNPAAATAAGVSFIRAGLPFSVTVTAMNSLGSATPNYGKEIVPESVKLTPSNVVAGMVAPPAIAGAFGNFASGVASGASFTWGEVGIIKLTPSMGDGDYLGAGDVTGTISGNVGRFIPDHFDTVVTGPMTCPSGLTCPAGGLVYSGQAFTTQMTARNAAGATTVNYNTTTGLSRDVTLSAYDAAGGANINPAAGTLSANAVTASAFSAGVASVTTPVYTFTTTPVTPTDIYVRALDTDSVSSLRGVSSVEGGIKVVSGRYKISNAYGSEMLPLPMTATVQFYNTAGNWVTSTSDSMTSFNTATNLVASIVTGPLAVGNISVVGAGSVTVSGGVKSFTLNKPLVSGSADIGLSAPAYLLAGSNTAGVDPSVKGRATFGVYKGNTNFIYQRESY